MSKRILVILPYIPSATGRRPNKVDAIYSTINAIQSDQYEVLVFSTGWEEEHPFNSIKKRFSFTEQIKIISLKILSRLGIVSRDTMTKYIANIQLEIIKSFHDENSIDLTIAYGTSSSTIKLAYYIFAKLNIPYVLREHRTFYQRVYKNISDIPKDEAKALNYASKLLAVSPQLIRNMKGIGVKKEISCLPNSIPNNFFSPPETSSVFKKWSNGRFIFAGWTNWRSFKRLDLLVDAFKIVNSKIDNTCLVVAGPIENSDLIKEKLSEFSLKDSVMLFGNSTRKEIHDLAHVCDCCVVPSDYETFGLPCLEANAAGKPAVVTKCGGPESIITNDYLGLVVEKNNAEKLAEAMISIHDNYYNVNSEEIKSHTYKLYSKDAVKMKWDSILGNLLQN